MTPAVAAPRWFIVLSVFLALMLWIVLVIGIYVLWPFIAWFGLGLCVIVVVDGLRGRS